MGQEIAEHVGCLPLIIESDSQELVNLVSFEKKKKYKRWDFLDYNWSLKSNDEIKDMFEIEVGQP